MRPFLPFAFSSSAELQHEKGSGRSSESKSGDLPINYREISYFRAINCAIRAHSISTAAAPFFASLGVYAEKVTVSKDIWLGS